MCLKTGVHLKTRLASVMKSHFISHHLVFFSVSSWKRGNDKLFFLFLARGCKQRAKYGVLGVARPRLECNNKIHRWERRKMQHFLMIIFSKFISDSSVRYIALLRYLCCCLGWSKPSRSIRSSSRCRQRACSAPAPRTRCTWPRRLPAPATSAPDSVPEGTTLCLSNQKLLSNDWDSFNSMQPLNQAGILLEIAFFFFSSSVQISCCRFLLFGYFSSGQQGNDTSGHHSRSDFMFASVSPHPGTSWSQQNTKLLNKTNVFFFWNTSEKHGDPGDGCCTYCFTKSKLLQDSEVFIFSQRWNWLTFQSGWALIVDGEW